MRYDEEWTAAEIGKALGVSESRVCQLLPEIVSRVAARMRGADSNPRDRRHGQDEAPSRRRYVPPRRSRWSSWLPELSVEVATT